jgi:hypothetical protein
MDMSPISSGEEKGTGLHTPGALLQVSVFSNLQQLPRRRRWIPRHRSMIDPGQPWVTISGSAFGWDDRTWMKWMSIDRLPFGGSPRRDARP